MKPLIRIRHDHLALVRAATGLTTTAALAKAMKVHPTTVARTLKGEAQLGSDFIAAVLAAFPGVPFDQLFAVESATETAIPA